MSGKHAKHKPFFRRNRIFALPLLAGIGLVIAFPHGGSGHAEASMVGHAPLIFSEGPGHAQLQISQYRYLPHPVPVRPVATTPHHTSPPAPKPPPSSAPTQSTTPPPPSQLVPSGALTCAQVGELWLDADGSPSAEHLAEQIAFAESSGGTGFAQQYATGAAGEKGYWQINPVNDGLVINGYTVEASYDPMTNAKDAVAMSYDGSNWSPWTTYTRGLYGGYC